MSLIFCIFLCVATNAKLLNQIGRLYIPNVGINGAENVGIDVHSKRIFAADGGNFVGVVVMNYSISSDLTNMDIDFEGRIELANIVGQFINGDTNTIYDVPSLSVSSNGYLLATCAPVNYARDEGYLVFINMTTLEVFNVIKMDNCYLPDHVSTTHDGNNIIISCEAEPNEFVYEPLYHNEGSVQIINVTDVNNPIQYNINFNEFDYIFDTGYDFGYNGNSSIYRNYDYASFSLNCEPEYTTISDDDRLIFVGLQEANAIAVIELETHNILGVFGLGFMNINYTGMDTSDKDDAINIKRYPNLYAMKQPDSISYFSLNGRHLIAIANEGDSKDFDESRVNKLNLSPELTPFQDDSLLGRLKVTNQAGYYLDINNQSIFDELYTFSSRNFEVWEYIEGSNTFDMVYSSGNDFEVKTSEILGTNGFNSNYGKDTFDSRSDDKGPEPEAIGTLICNGDAYVFIGMERVSGIFGYKIDSELNGEYIEYETNRDFTNDNITWGNDDRPPINAGDIAPENIKILDGYYDKPLLLVANTQSSSVTVYRIDCDNTTESSNSPTSQPSNTPTTSPTIEPSISPTESPTIEPTMEPTIFQVTPNESSKNNRKTWAYVGIGVGSLIAIILGIILLKRFCVCNNKPTKRHEMKQSLLEM